MMKRLLFLILVASCCGTLMGQRLQTPTLSPFTEISQHLGLSSITLTYSRPSAKGRKVFGGLVPYGEVWRTAANASSKITFTEAVQVGGQAVPAGTYAIYSIPGPSTWTIILHKNLKLRSLAGGGYQASNDLCRFEVAVRPNAHKVETFTMQFADLTYNSCQLLIKWEYVTVAIPIQMPVEAGVEAQIDSLFSDPSKASARNYFAAAQFYLEIGSRLEQAIDYIDLALGKDSDNFRYALLKSKILHKQGNKEEALKVVEEAHEMAKTANNANYIEQTRLYKEVIKAS
ncbi:MAG: DUF2911 domain-containing protein [Bacteroidota bacterium]